MSFRYVDSRFIRNSNSTHVQCVGNAHETRIRMTNTRAVVYKQKTPLLVEHGFPQTAFIGCVVCKSFTLYRFLIFAFLFTLIIRVAVSVLYGCPKKSPRHSFNVLIIPILSGCLYSHFPFPPVFYFTDRSRRGFFCGPFLLFMFRVCLCYAVLSVPCSIVTTCWECSLVC